MMKRIQEGDHVSEDSGKGLSHRNYAQRKKNHANSNQSNPLMV